MPPPKKPKKGPTSADQFLSDDDNSQSSPDQNEANHDPSSRRRQADAILLKIDGLKTEKLDQSLIPSCSGQSSDVGADGKYQGNSLSKSTGATSVLGNDTRTIITTSVNVVPHNLRENTFIGKQSSLLSTLICLPPSNDLTLLQNRTDAFLRTKHHLPSYPHKSYSLDKWRLYCRPRAKPSPTSILSAMLKSPLIVRTSDVGSSNSDINTSSVLNRSNVTDFKLSYENSAPKVHDGTRGTCPSQSARPVIKLEKSVYLESTKKEFDYLTSTSKISPRPSSKGFEELIVPECELSASPISMQSNDSPVFLDKPQGSQPPGCHLNPTSLMPLHVTSMRPIMTTVASSSTSSLYDDASCSSNQYDHSSNPSSSSGLDIKDILHCPVASSSLSSCGQIDEVKADLQDSVPGSSINRQCQVCSDSASGFHYGVWSCEGCKAFFKRSVQGKVDYICPASNTCTIDRIRRKSCQACRLRKCLEVGMNKIMTHQRKERRLSGCTSTVPNTSKVKLKRKLDCSQQFSCSPPLFSSTKKESGRPNVLVQALSQVDSPLVDCGHNISLPRTLDNLLSSLSTLLNKELVYLINWVKHIPGYSELDVSIQAHLIECSWMELLLLTSAYRSQDHNGRLLVFASDLHLSSYDWQLLGLSESLEEISEISVQLTSLNVQWEEILVIKALLVTNAEIRKLSNPGQLSGMQRSLLEALHETSHSYHPYEPSRVSSLLLLLPHIRRASFVTVSQLRRLKHERSIMYSDLLSEVLEPCGIPDRTSHQLSQDSRPRTDLSLLYWNNSNDAM